MVIAAVVQGFYCLKIQASTRASFTWNVGQVPTRLPWVEHFAYPHSWSILLIPILQQFC